jgi:hypothetical protein
VTARDVDLLAHKVDTLTRAATRIRAHLHDLHALAFETQRRNTEPDGTGFESRPPPGWKGGHEHSDGTWTPDRSRQLWDRIAHEVSRVEDILVGLERDVLAHFFAHSANPEPSRGSLISAAEHQRLLANQRTRAAAGEYVPARLADQPPHPGRRR